MRAMMCCSARCMGILRMRFRIFSVMPMRPALDWGPALTTTILCQQGRYLRSGKRLLVSALSRIVNFSPQYLVVSLGVDAFENDPISFFKLTSSDFLTTGQMIGAIDIPTLFVMEGGYDVDEVGINVVNVLKGFQVKTELG